MSEFSCLKVTNLGSLMINLFKIKTLINKCLRQKKEKIDTLDINEVEKLKIIKELNKKLNLVTNKYNIIHNKLYHILDVISNYECSTSKINNCEKNNFCINSKENEELWLEVDSLYERINSFYYETKVSLISEIELCLFRLNKIKKISYLLA